MAFDIKVSKNLCTIAAAGVVLGGFVGVDIQSELDSDLYTSHITLNKQIETALAHEAYVRSNVCGVCAATGGTHLGEVGAVRSLNMGRPGVDPFYCKSKESLCRGKECSIPLKCIVYLETNVRTSRDGPKPANFVTCANLNCIFRE